jgi:PPM family protein phosphatase
MKAFGLSDVGCKRSMNQDAFYADNEKQIYIVADGMGGHKAGELASKMAVEAICKILYEEELDEDKSTLNDQDFIDHEEENCRFAVEYANEVIYQKSNESLEFHGMGTTVVLLKINKGNAIIAHVGDSRIYRIQDEEIHQLTKDHSRLQELIDQKRISAEEAERYPLRNVITRALGGSPDVIVDTKLCPLGINDLFILCTDGLTSVISDTETLEIVSSNPGNPEESCRRLIQSTIERGAPDNVTVLICDTRAYSGGEPHCPPNDPMPSNEESPGAFRRFIDRWFKGC